jgi:dolichol-phosphate mannosyltransferase
MEDKITKENKFVSAVVYLHNDAEYVGDFLDMIDKIFSEGFTGYELIFVDDASTDDGVAKIRSYYKDKDKTLGITSIIRLSHYQGQECAMNAGRDFAIGDFVYEFDDMIVDYDPSLITEIYKKALTGYDIVSAGCKNAVSLSSKTFYGIYNKLSRSGEELSTESFRILSRRAINQVKSLDRYIPYRKAIYMNCGLNTTTVKYSAADPAKRRAAIRSRHDRSSLAMDSFIYFTDAMEKLAGFICITFAIIAIVVGIDIIYETAAFTRPVEGWRSIMGFLAIGFFGMFLVLAIIMRHLSVLIDLNFRRSRYLVSGIEKVTKE